MYPQAIPREPHVETYRCKRMFGQHPGDKGLTYQSPEISPGWAPKYCLFGVNYFFSIFIFYAWFGMLSKGMGKSFLLSEDEPLTPNIDGVMALWIFRRRAQTAENRRKLDL